MKKIIFYIFTWIFLLFFYSSSYSYVSLEIYNQIKKDFSPISAFIVGFENGKFIIDKGSYQGIKVNDIFSVYKEGKKIIDPKTGKTVGYKKTLIGKVEITDVEEDFSTAKVISQKESFPIPTPVKRFTDLKVLVISKKPDKKLLSLLKNTLLNCKVIYNSKLKFKALSLSYILSHGIDLIFVEEGGSIRVYNSELSLIRCYGNLDYRSVILEANYTLKSSKGFPSLTPIMIRKTKLGIIQAEFQDLNKDKIPEMIYLTKDGLFISDIDGKVLTGFKPEEGEILNFSISSSGIIALNVYENRVGMRSVILKYTQEGLKPLIKDIDLILNFVDLNNTGKKDTLIGQTFDPENFFGKNVYLLSIKNNQLIYVKNLKVPENYENIGSVFVDLDGDGNVEILNYLPDGKIGIYKNNNLVWETPYPVANNFYDVKLIKGKPENQVIKKIIKLLISPVVVDLNRDGIPDVIFVSTSFPLESVRADLRYIPLNSASSQILCLSFKDTYFFKKLTGFFKGFITGLSVLNNTVYFINVQGKYPGDLESTIYFSYF